MWSFFPAITPQESISKIKVKTETKQKPAILLYIGKRETRIFSQSIGYAHFLVKNIILFIYKGQKLLLKEDQVTEVCTEKPIIGFCQNPGKAGQVLNAGTFL